MKAWKEARLDREWRAGLLLGVAAVIKFYPALFVLRSWSGAVCVWLLPLVSRLD